MWWSEYVGEQTDPQEIGTVEISAEYEIRRKPVWLVILKMAGLALMLPVGLFLVVPWIPLPLWQSLAIAVGVLAIYVGLAFFIRPEPNTDNMGWAGGLINDPFHYSDNVNRSLWSLHCFLGPGRFAAGTVLDTCALIGLAPEARMEEVTPPEHAPPEAQGMPPGQPPPRADRFETAEDFKFGGAVELSSARFMQQQGRP